MRKARGSAAGMGLWLGPLVALAILFLTDLDPERAEVTAMAAVATTTERASIGLMVGANTFRNPALVAKMITTIDHISDGRAVLGVGAGWHVQEHQQFGFRFGAGPPERLRWLAEALPIMRGMLDGERPTALGEHYRVHEALNEPGPVQLPWPSWATDTSSSTSPRRTMRRS